jgi:hypothetical protein
MRSQADVILTCVSDLRYGAVAINASPILAYAVPSIPWGAWAAAGVPQDIGTGNVLLQSGMFDHAEKGVLWVPFRLAPTPILHTLHTNWEELLMSVAAYVKARGPFTLMRAFWAALRAK